MVNKYRLGKEELSTAICWRDIVAEILNSTILLIFLTFNQINYFESWKVTPTHVGLVMALIVCVLVESFGHIGGAHMNPCVTFIMFCRGEIGLLKAVFYTIAQCCGGAAGSGIVYGLTPSDHRNAFSPFLPAAAVGPVRGTMFEMIISFVLCFVILAVTDPKRGTACNMPGLPIGLAVGVNIMCVMSYTGAAINPIVALGPAVITGKFKHHWVYWVGPYLGAALAVAMYFGLTAIKDKTPSADKQEDEQDEEMVNALESLLMEQRAKRKIRSEKGQVL